MKKLLLVVFAFGIFVAEIPAANAVVCARGLYRAGCAGPRGAVVAHRPYGYRGAAVVHPVRHCYWRRGVRICR